MMVLSVRLVIVWFSYRGSGGSVVMLCEVLSVCFCVCVCVYM